MALLQTQALRNREYPGMESSCLRCLSGCVTSRCITSALSQSPTEESRQNVLKAPLYPDPHPALHRSSPVARLKPVIFPREESCQHVSEGPLYPDLRPAPAWRSPPGARFQRGRAGGTGRRAAPGPRL